MHLPPLLIDLAIILGAAGIVSLIFQRIRQPVVLGYVLAGFLIGPHTPPFALVKDVHTIQIWAELGVIFLMFSLGLEFSFRKLSAVGLSAGVTASVEVIFMLFLGFITGRALGWSPTDSIFLGAMLSISSTTIIIKALGELNLKTKRFAEMIFAILIVEDLIAILILVALTAVANKQGLSGLTLLTTAAKLIMVVGSWFLSGYFLVPRFIKYAGKIGTDETLAITSIALCLGLVIFAAYLDYPIALGAFIMGSILAETTESHRISERIEPLRDLFASIFFVSVGMLINPTLIWAHFGTILLVSAITIIGKIISVTIGALLTGQSMRRSVQVGFGLAQIGEFSFIIASLGLTFRMTSDFVYPVGVAVSIITTFTTPYLIRVSHRFAVSLEDRLSPGIRDILQRYLTWVQLKQTDTARKKELSQSFSIWLLNGIIISTCFLSSSHYLNPLFLKSIPNPPWAPFAAWLITVIFTAPFIWAMLTAFKVSKHPSEKRMTRRIGLNITFGFLSMFWLGALSLAFLPWAYVILLILSLELSLVILFYQEIENSYRWFETQFLSTFEPHQKSHIRKSVSKSLAPWDARLTRIKVHPNAEVITQKLHEVKLRDKHGINVVVIQRGNNTIVAPKPDELILPQDELLVLGTNEQLEKIRPFLEKAKYSEEGSRGITHYDLKQFRLTEKSPFVGKTIRTAGIRENFDAMVVGVERDQSRIINPHSDFRLKQGDILWIVGDPTKLEAI